MDLTFKEILRHVNVIVLEQEEEGEVVVVQPFPMKKLERRTSLLQVVVKVLVVVKKLELYLHWVPIVKVMVAVDFQGE